MVLLKAQPSLMAKSISSVALATWEPVATMEYYCALSQLTFLCASVDVDTQFKVDMKTLVNSATADGPSEKGAIKADISMRGLTSGFLQAMIPAGTGILLRTNISIPKIHIRLIVSWSSH